MNLIDKRTASVLFTVLIFALLLGLIYQARRPLTAFIFAILFAYLLDPIVARFQAWLRASRGLSSWLLGSRLGPEFLQRE
jgi:predicted PurR-regulated permease PerM